MDFVWVFSGPRNHFPSGVFATREQAEAWIEMHRLEGTLTKYPVGISAYDFAIQQGHFTPRKPEHSSPAFIANFSSATQDHYHYEREG